MIVMIKGMGKLSVLLTVLIVLSIVETEASLLTENYVTPNKTIGCSSNRSQSHCLTLQEYANQPDKYLKNFTTFYFEPGNHTLNRSLKLNNLNNITFQGLPDSELVTVSFEMFVTITWERCWNIKISSIIVALVGNFTYSIVFNQAQMVFLLNISVISSDRVSGCSSIVCHRSILFIGNCYFIGIRGSFGAAMLISESNATFIGNSIFFDNTASYGGSIYSFKSSIFMIGSSIFVNNNASNKSLKCNNNYTQRRGNHVLPRGSGGAIFCASSDLGIFNYRYSESIFANNYAQGYGGAISAIDGFILILGPTSFETNVGHQGGAILLYHVDLLLTGNISFINNKAVSSGGALMLYTSVILEILLTNIIELVESKNLIISMDGRGVDNSNLSFVDKIQFYGNEAVWGGAIKCVSSGMILNGSLCFESNRALNGGAIHLADTSELILSPFSNVSFIRNHANSTGGALYVKDSQCSLGSPLPIQCFLSIFSNDSNYATAKLNISLVYLNNSAGSIGSTLYGGQLNKCRLYYKATYSKDVCDNAANEDYSDDALGIFMNMSRIIQPQSATNISSRAEQIKFCQGENLLDNQTKDFKLHPGEQFIISIRALDQIGSPVLTTVVSQNEYTGDDYRLSPSNQQINGSCSNITLELLSIEENCSKSFKLYSKNPCKSLADGLKLEIDILPCPIGFELIDHRCKCDEKLQQFTEECIIQKSAQMFKRMRNYFWISQTSVDVLIIHEYRCPLDYCKDDSIIVSLNDPSVQCDINRNGTLCGQCQKNFSLALGSLHCIPCDNNHAVLIMFFALAGIVLITIIFIFQLTVPVGTLSGLLFYANIIQANHQAFFPREINDIKFFTIFISWLNLDLGIETCFYDGMDIYAYSWFQFLFPFYIWFLVGCIILACHYSQTIAKRLGQNPVAVLATLLLISFSKILQAIIVPLSWTHLIYYTGTASNETRSVVWLYDASIHFFKESKHTALGLFAIISLVVFVLPYIFLLLFGHWLQGCSNWWVLSWLNKIKPFMDAYHAPYRKHTRYWTGLLLLSRLGLFLTFAINANGSESVNLVAVSSVSLALLAIQRRVYEQRWKDLLESFFILNLGIFSVATFYLKEESKDASQFIISSISVGIAFIVLIGILIYHICLVFKSASSLWKVHLLPFIQKSHRIFRAMSVSTSEDERIGEGEKSTELRTLPTFSEIGVDLREPLLELESGDSESRAATY